MVNAIILLTVERDKINSVAESVAATPGVTEVFSVGGRFDLVAIIRVKTNERLADLVTGQLLRTEGIRSSETLIAFKAYSKHDIEGMFSIGMDD